MFYALLILVVIILALFIRVLVLGNTHCVITLSTVQISSDGLQSRKGPAGKPAGFNRKTKREMKLGVFLLAQNLGKLSHSKTVKNHAKENQTQDGDRHHPGEAGTLRFPVRGLLKSAPPVDVLHRPAGDGSQHHLHLRLQAPDIPLAMNSVATVVYHEDLWFPLVLWIFYGLFRVARVQL